MICKTAMGWANSGSFGADKLIPVSNVGCQGIASGSTSEILSGTAEDWIVMQQSCSTREIWIKIPAYVMAVKASSLLGLECFLLRHCDGEAESCSAGVNVSPSLLAISSLSLIGETLLSRNDVADR